MNLVVLPGRFAVCRLAPDSPLPPQALSAPFYSVTRTPDELSLVLPEEFAAFGAGRVEPGWACLQVRGPLDFGLTGVLASLAVPLADAGVSLFAVSTYDTDYLLVRADRLPDAVRALEKAGHDFPAPGGDSGTRRGEFSV